MTYFDVFTRVNIKISVCPVQLKACSHLGDNGSTVPPQKCLFTVPDLEKELSSYGRDCPLGDVAASNSWELYFLENLALPGVRGMGRKCHALPHLPVHDFLLLSRVRGSEFSSSTLCFFPW